MLSLLAYLWAWLAGKFTAELQLLREIWHRLSSPKPRFWKRVQARAATTAASIGGIIASGYVPEAWLPYFKGAALLFLGLAAAAQLPCIDGSETPPPTDSPAS
jgi:hypothetical protein